MSSEPFLAIECFSFSILGSSGEATFGNPKPITVHPDLHQWSECLKRDGGAGCVLFCSVGTSVCDMLIIFTQEHSKRQEIAPTGE